MSPLHVLKGASRILILTALLVLILLASILIILSTSSKPAVDQKVEPRQLSLANISNMSLEIAFPNLSFERMVYLTQAGNDAKRFFLVLQRGEIQVFPNRRDVNSTKLFLNITDRVESTGNEQGLLALTFDPDFQRNGYFYSYYTAASPSRSILSRFSQDTVDLDQADPNSETIILEIPQPYANHNGGQIVFGPDGYLYLSLGDGGGGGDPQRNGQNLGTLLGKMLRIDVRNITSNEKYRIPQDNPFVNVAGARGEIWAYGLRNPWRFSFDNKTGLLWAADVGQNEYEEIDIIKKGGNYGWNIMEGIHCYPTSISNCNKNTDASNLRVFACRWMLSHRRIRLPRQPAQRALGSLYLRRLLQRQNLGVPLQRITGNRECSTARHAAPNIILRRRRRERTLHIIIRRQNIPTSLSRPVKTGRLLLLFIGASLKPPRHPRLREAQREDRTLKRPG